MSSFPATQLATTFGSSFVGPRGEIHVVPFAVRMTTRVTDSGIASVRERYREAGGDYYTRIDPDKQTKRLVAQLERLGHSVTLQERAAA